MESVSAGIRVPKVQLDLIREQIPETQYMTPGRILRYALARTIGLSHEDAMKACQDTRSRMARSVLEDEVSDH
jgi:hypothetical protein